MIKTFVYLLIATLMVGGTWAAQNFDYKFTKSSVNLRLVNLGTASGVKLHILRGTAVIQSINVGVDFGNNAVRQVIPGGFSVTGNGKKLDFTVTVDEADFSFVKIARSQKKGDVVEDCIDLGTEYFRNWFGGPQRRYQFWPIQHLNFTDFPYVSQENQNVAITERYWLSSEGVFVFVDAATPLFITQVPEEQLCLAAKKTMPYYTYDDAFTFIYHIGVSTNARTAHMKAVEHVLKKPTGHPAERMVRHPVWSTWARYKVNINDAVVKEFATEILDNKFNNSQYEIDDDWEVCYGALTFRESKFPNIKQLTDDLKASGFMVTLWIHPFINKGCDPWYSEGKEKGYFVLNREGNPDTQWWNSKTGEAAYIDFTKPEAAQWYVNRLKALQVSAGIDNYKFDAGESSWSPPDAVLQGSTDLRPNLITSAYIRTVATFGDLVEVRSGQGTQDLPIFLRMIDKDSEWGLHNGIQTLITTLLQLNMVGYPLVLPDMIGGNGYNGAPSRELFIRWLAANVFMPSLQFSYVPWDYDDYIIELSHQYVDMHNKYTDKIMERFKLAVSNGDPVNPPIWWVDPTDYTAQTIWDQFMLGDDILVAPIVKEGRKTRDIYLPKGQWKDGNTGALITGRVWLKSYWADLDVLPHFIKVG